MQPRSSSSAGAIYLSLDQRIGELQAAARRAKKRDPSIARVILFGSLATGTASPRSDADVLVVVKLSPHPHMRDRIPGMLAAFAPLPGPLDLFVLTQIEFDRGRDERAPLLREVLQHGRDLLDC